MQSPLADIAKLRDNHVILLVILLALIGPGIGTLLVFFPEAFADLDVFKVLLVSACFGLGLSLPLSIVLLARYSAALSGTEGRLATCLTISSIVTLVTAVILLSLAYTYAWEFRTYLIVTAGMCVVAWPLVLGVLPILRKRGLI